MGGPGPGEPGERKAEGEMLAGVKLSGSGNWGKNIEGGGGGCSVLTLAWSLEVTGEGESGQWELL